MSRSIDDCIEDLLDQPGCSDEDIPFDDGIASSSTTPLLTLIDVDLFDVDLQNAKQLTDALRERRLAIRTLEINSCGNCNATALSSLFPVSSTSSSPSQLTQFTKAVTISSCELSAESLSISLNGMLHLAHLQRLVLSSAQLDSDMGRAVISFLVGRHDLSHQREQQQKGRWHQPAALRRRFELDLQHNPSIDELVVGELLIVASQHVTKLSLSGCSVGQRAIEQLAAAVSAGNVQAPVLSELEVDQIPELPLAQLFDTIFQPGFHLRRLNIAWSGMDNQESETIDWSHVLGRIQANQPTLEDLDLGEHLDIPVLPDIYATLERNTYNNLRRSPLLLQAARVIYEHQLNVAQLLPADRHVFKQLLPALWNDELANDSDDDSDSE